MALDQWQKLWIINTVFPPSPQVQKYIEESEPQIPEDFGPSSHLQEIFYVHGAPLQNNPHRMACCLQA